MTIVVLGCEVYNRRPGKILTSRLETALAVANECDDLIIVSGKGESVPMYRWLVERGIEPLRIWCEDHATSTNENLENSYAELLKAPFPADLPMKVVTSDFHKFRTHVWAWHLGIPITVTTAMTPAPFRQRAFLRELSALPHSALRVIWRKFRRWLSA
ncbi:MAG: YdcF family protein [Corynebacterium sp.]|uniref:YdcF family protein n=1 Tax=Corynebacterium sp. TaxID=1720 RepID=UPI0026DA8BD9|nr:YdcF family protein [Corynebacterium sp.]MDO5097634.1 YdcF family protein [Corynebacterium sp.]